jgi:ABC-2 type transport system permease protein
VDHGVCGPGRPQRRGGQQRRDDGDLPPDFISNAFVPAENLVTPLRIFAQWNPISAATQASRELFGNLPAVAGEPTAWSLQHPVAYTLLWTVLLIAVFGPLSIRRFSRS